MFGIEGDWEAEKETVYDQLQDIDLVSDLIIAPDPIHANPMRHSMSVPIAPVSFSSNLSSDLPNRSQVHSLPQTFDHLPDFREHVEQSWAVPALKYSSYGSSADAEVYFNGLESDLSVYSAVSPSPEIGLSPFLHPYSVQQYFQSESTVSRAESNASVDSAHDDEYEPAIERFNAPSIPSGGSALTIAHRQPSRRTKRSSPGPGIGKKSSRGRKGPLRLDDRLTTSEMRKVGACQACRDRKTKVNTIGFLFGHCTY